MPDDPLDAVLAATFSQSHCTGLFALREHGGLKPGETVMVLVAGGGVGLAAVQVARTLGARVLAGASSPAKRDTALAAGAEAVLNTKAEDIKTKTRGWSDGGVDLVYDPSAAPLPSPHSERSGNAAATW